MNSLLTVVITASHIKSHPSIRIIKETIESLQYVKLPENTRIILSHDYSTNTNFNTYIQNLKEYIQISNQNNIEIKICDSHVHLTGNVRNAFKDINSKYTLVIQHDLPFISHFEISKIIEDMDQNTLMKYVRFNKRDNIRKGFDAGNNLFGKQYLCKNYTYTRTPAWSDNNHLCLTSYYNNVVLKECRDGKPMELFLNGRVKDEQAHQRYGTFLFGPINHPQMILHLDGKNSKE